jgi:hypothetical protein
MTPPAERPAELRPHRSASRFAQWLTVGLVLFGAAAAGAQDAPRAQPAIRPSEVEEIVIRGRSDSLIGAASTASVGTIGAEQIERRTIARPGEVLETVPGVIVTQHSGGGKANQFFLRGFNLDHGTDFATSLNGVPVNLTSHGHGQGYTDLNFMIPELVERVNYSKGVYYAEHGDFSSAGAASLEYFRELPSGLARIEAGRFGYQRSVIAASPKLGPGHLLYALELQHAGGASSHPDDYRKYNAVLRYSREREDSGWSVTGSAYAGDFDSTDQIAERSLALPGFGRFDSMNDSDGGRSQKYQISAEWHRRDEDAATRVVGYAFVQNLELYSDFTYFLTSPDGDQFLQTDRRKTFGGSATHTWFADLRGRETETTVGLQVRSDLIRNGFFQTVRRHRTDKLDHDGDLIPSVTRDDDLWQSSVAPFVQSRIQWSDRIRTTLGVRADLFRFDVRRSKGNQSRGSENEAVVSPKATITFGPWADTEVYLSAGLGFHSNDTRGVRALENRADPLVRTHGSEIGLRTTLLPGLQSTVALWQLDSDGELLFVGDAGTTEATRPSYRHGLELANYWSPAEWLTLDADFSVSRSRFRDSDPAGDEIPGSLEKVAAFGISLHDMGALSGNLRLRYFGPRPLIEDDSVRSDATVQLNARIDYQWTQSISISLEALNLLGSKDSEIDYFYASRLSGEDAGPDEGGVNSRHFKPVEPFSFRVALTTRF